MESTTTSKEGSLSYYIQVKNKHGITINIPVIDVRDGVGERLLAEQFIRSSNRSKYMNYNQYHVSPKKSNS